MIGSLFKKWFFLLYLIVPSSRFDKLLKFLDAYGSTYIAKERFESQNFNNISPLQVDGISSAILNSANEVTSITVFDFGGGVGSGYLKFRGLFDVRIRLNYLVIETNSVVEASQFSIMEIKRGDSVSWLTRSELMNYDENYSDFRILYSDSCMQYIQDVTEDFLYLIDWYKPKLVVIERTPYSFQESFEGTQISLLSSHLAFNGFIPNIGEKLLANHIYFHSVSVFKSELKNRNYKNKFFCTNPSRTFRRYGRNVKLSSLVFENFEE